MTDTTASVTAEDWQKYIRAKGRATLAYVLGGVAGNLSEQVPDDQADAVYEAVESVRELLDTLPVADQLRYGDGRQVVSSVELAYHYQFEHIWHPDPAHPSNQPSESLAVFDLPGGGRKRVVVSAPDVLDAIDVLRPV